VPWIKLITSSTTENTEALSDLISDAGAAAVTIEDNADQPLFEPPPGETPLWQANRITGLFEADTDMKAVVERLQSNWTATPFPEHRIEILEDKDWVRAWMDDFKPMQFGKRLWVVPSWHQPPEPDAANLMLDPGLAFGTGTHPTTSLCLQWLDAQNMEGKTAIDYGCGSGVLAVAALLLGAEKVWGIDNDPQALTASKDNAGRNGIDLEKFSLHYPRETPTLEVDFIVANILAAPLIELAPSICALLKPEGHIALSGILDHQAESVMEAYRPWIEFEPMATQEEWVRLNGKKVNNH